MGASPGPGRKEHDDDDGDEDDDDKNGDDDDDESDDDAGVIGSPVCCPKSVCDGSSVPILPIT